MENLKNVAPIEDFNWDAYENGETVTNVSHDELEKAYEPDFLGVKDQRFGTPIAQPLSERRLSGAERSVDPDYHCRRPLT